MNERDEIVRKTELLKVINRALDYSENLIELAGKCIDDKNASDAKMYWYAGNAFKTFAEELLDEEEGEKERWLNSLC